MIELAYDVKDAAHWGDALDRLQRKETPGNPLIGEVDLSEFPHPLAAQHAFSAVGQAVFLIDEVTRDIVDAQALKIAAVSRERTIEAWRRAVNIDVKDILQEADINEHMMMWRRHNVSLIKTIPERAHEGLIKRMEAAMMTAPFDQHALEVLYAQEYRVSGYNLRRLARDQTTKAMAQLDEIRQTQLGITHYKWRAVRDDRVPPTHLELDGTVQAWANPHAIGHPCYSIHCRCAAEAQLD